MCVHENSKYLSMSFGAEIHLLLLKTLMLPHSKTPGGWSWIQESETLTPTSTSSRFFLFTQLSWDIHWKKARKRLQTPLKHTYTNTHTHTSHRKFMWAYEHYSSTTENISKMQKVKKEINWKLEAVKPYWGKSLPELKIADIIKESGFYKSLIGWSKSPVIPKIIAWKKALSDLSAWKGAANADNGRGSPTSPPSAGAPAVMGWICLRMNAASLFSPLTYVNISCGCLLSTTWKRCLCSLFLQPFHFQVSVYKYSVCRPLGKVWRMLDRATSPHCGQSYWNRNCAGVPKHPPKQVFPCTHSLLPHLLPGTTVLSKTSFFKLKLFNNSVAYIRKAVCLNVMCEPLSRSSPCLPLLSLSPTSFLYQLKTLHVVVIVQSLCHVQLFVTPWTAACQASLSFTISWSLLKLTSIESVMPSSHLVLCCPLLLPSVFPSIGGFSKESALHIRWSQYWSFSFSISPEYSQWIFRTDFL